MGNLKVEVETEVWEKTGTEQQALEGKKIKCGTL